MEQTYRYLDIEGTRIKVSNPNKILFSSIGMSKWEYVLNVSKLAPYLLPYCKNRLLTMIRFPDGSDGKFFYQKNSPKNRPIWVETFRVKEKEYILLNNIQTLVWLSNLACLEFHTSFNLVSHEDNPTDLVFDIDPSVPDFNKVIDVALETKAALDKLNLSSFVKTSGASGLQVYVPILKRYSYAKTRKVTKFLARYLKEKRPDIVTLERRIEQRGDRVYFDYLQHWRNKSLIAPYSPRGTREATISCPVYWDELRSSNIHPTHFSFNSIFTRIDQVGDIFKPLQHDKSRNSLDEVLAYIEGSRYE